MALIAGRCDVCGQVVAVGEFALPNLALGQVVVSDGPDMPAGPAFATARLGLETTRTCPCGGSVSAIPGYFEVDSGSLTLALFEGKTADQRRLYQLVASIQGEQEARQLIDVVLESLPGAKDWVNEQLDQTSALEILSVLLGVLTMGDPTPTKLIALLSSLLSLARSRRDR